MTKSPISGNSSPGPKRHPRMPRRGFEVGNLVRIDHSHYNRSVTLPYFRDVFGDNVGRISEFLDDTSCANNGAACVQIMTTFEQVITTYVSTRYLLKAADARETTHERQPDLASAFV
jgi:hypothetical protein